MSYKRSKPGGCACVPVYCIGKTATECVVLLNKMCTAQYHNTICYVTSLEYKIKIIGSIEDFILKPFFFCVWLFVGPSLSIIIPLKFLSAGAAFAWEYSRTLSLVNTALIRESNHRLLVIIYYYKYKHLRLYVHSFIKSPSRGIS